jgi:hypothetical protein
MDILHCQEPDHLEQEEQKLMVSHKFPAFFYHSLIKPLLNITPE